jgi:hypothetical protein
MSYDALRRFQRLRDRPRDAAPSLGFRFQLLQSRFRQPVIFRPAVILRLSPKRCNPPLFFHAVQGRKQRSRLHHESPARNLLDPPRNPQPMHLPRAQRFQNQQIQSPLQKARLFRAHSLSPIVVLYGTYAPSYRMSIGKKPAPHDPSSHRQSDHAPSLVPLASPHRL